MTTWPTATSATGFDRLACRRRSAAREPRLLLLDEGVHRGPVVLRGTRPALELVLLGQGVGEAVAGRVGERFLDRRVGRGRPLGPPAGGRRPPRRPGPGGG